MAGKINAEYLSAATLKTNKNMDQHGIRNFKDFLLHYNRITENCFMQCASDLTCRNMTQDEATCVEKCAYKHVKVNNRAMQVYVEVQPAMTQKRMEELSQQQAKLQLQQQQAEIVSSTEVA